MALKPIGPTDEEIRDAILGMGAEEVRVVRKEEAIYISFFKSGGCGRIWKCACNYLARKLPSTELVLLESPRRGDWCYKANVREPRQKRFVRKSVMATPERIGEY